MANVTTRKPKQYPDPKDESPMVKYHLGWGQYMDQSKDEFLKTRINGYLYTLQFGKTTEVPENIVKLLEDARIRYIKDSPLRRFERTGEARPQGELMHNASEYADIPMYNGLRV